MQTSSPKLFTAKAAREGLVGQLEIEPDPLLAAERIDRFDERLNNLILFIDSFLQSFNADRKVAGFPPI